MNYYTCITPNYYLSQQHTACTDMMWYNCIRVTGNLVLTTSHDNKTIHSAHGYTTVTTVSYIWVVSYTICLKYYGIHWNDFHLHLWSNVAVTGRLVMKKQKVFVKSNWFLHKFPRNFTYNLLELRIQWR